MQKNLAVSSSPHLRDNVTTRRIMQEVCLALAPAGIAAIVLFGASAATLIAVSVITAVLAEFCWNKLNKQKTTVGDWSAVVTGLLLAYNLPANAPVWIAVVGAIIAIILVKQMFGGIGSNFMNPALAARAILFVSWSSLMTSYPATQFMTDVTSSATPLNLLGKGTVEGVNLMDLFLGNVPGVLGETCAITLLLGGIYLIATKVISPVIPVTYLATVAVLSAVSGHDPIVQLLSGGLMLGAFFMATDYVTSPTTNKGKLVFGIGLGIITCAIRFLGTMNEGVSFAILLMNLLVPYIEILTRQDRLGIAKAKKEGAAK